MFDAVGIATPLAIIALMNLFKRFGMYSNNAIFFAVIVGIVLNVSNYFLHGYELWTIVIQGIVVSLSACGVWDISKNIGVPVIIDPPEHAAVDTGQEDAVG